MTTPPLPLHISEDLLPSRPAKPPGITTLSFSARLHPPLQLHEDLKEGCGGQLWPAGMVLANYLLDRREELRGKVMFVCRVGHYYNMNCGEGFWKGKRLISLGEM